MKLKPTRRTDWANYIDPNDQEEARQQRWYRLSSRIEACLHADGRLVLVVEDEGRHTIIPISCPAQDKFSQLLKEAHRTWKTRNS